MIELKYRGFRETLSKELLPTIVVVAGHWKAAYQDSDVPYVVVG
jgi:hypothetical protein